MFRACVCAVLLLLDLTEAWTTFDVLRNAFSAP